MANGKNAGRLFSDCENEHGYGEYHAIDKNAKDGDRVQCSQCKRWFTIKEGKLVPEEATDAAS
jgi:uncharacterized protein YbaR (Trm112 family)